MVIAIILVLFAVALFLIFHDDHDDSYTRREKAPGRQNEPKSTYQKSTRRPAAVLDSRTVVPKEKEYRPRNDARAAGFAYEKKVLDFHFLDRIDYDPNLPERTMSSFIAGIQGHCSERDLGGLVGYVTVDRNTGGMEVNDQDDRLMGYLPMKDRAAFYTFNPQLVVCPFAGHVAHSVTGSFYADIRIVLPSTRDFVEESLTGFLG